jgi:hypothetical protein
VARYLDLRTVLVGDNTDAIASVFERLELVTADGIAIGGDATLSSGVDMILDSNGGSKTIGEIG